MIWTVTLNPALDYVVRLDNLALGETNRTNSEDIYLGGKGINVSSVLGQLGVKSVALGFVAGFTGEYLISSFKERGVDADFVFVTNGTTRINVKIKTDNETEINANGPCVSDDELAEFFTKIDKIEDGDTLVLSGSVPKNLPGDIYEQILYRIGDKDITVVVDASGDLLDKTLKYKPYLIKPNKDELELFWGKKITSDEDVIKASRLAIEKGAQCVLTSLGGDGAILVAKDKVYKKDAPKGVVKNAVGAGDSMVAGFLAGLIDSGDLESALSLGIAAGSATAFSDDLATKDKIYELTK